MFALRRAWVHGPRELKTSAMVSSPVLITAKFLDAGAGAYDFTFG
jgi:hypothetical protein